MLQLVVKVPDILLALQYRTAHILLVTTGKVVLV